MSQKVSDIEDENTVNAKPQFTDEVIGVVRNPECLLNDYDIALIFERDVEPSWKNSIIAIQMKYQKKK